MNETHCVLTYLKFDINMINSKRKKIYETRYIYIDTKWYIQFVSVIQRVNRHDHWIFTVAYIKITLEFLKIWEIVDIYNWRETYKFFQKSGKSKCFAINICSFDCWNSRLQRDGQWSVHMLYSLLLYIFPNIDYSWN